MVVPPRLDLVHERVGQPELIEEPAAGIAHAPKLHRLDVAVLMSPDGDATGRVEGRRPRKQRHDALVPAVLALGGGHAAGRAQHRGHRASRAKDVPQVDAPRVGHDTSEAATAPAGCWVRVPEPRGAGCRRRRRRRRRRRVAARGMIAAAGVGAGIGTGIDVGGVPAGGDEGGTFGVSDRARQDSRCEEACEEAAVAPALDVARLAGARLLHAHDGGALAHAHGGGLGVEVERGVEMPARGDRLEHVRLKEQIGVEDPSERVLGVKLEVPRKGQQPVGKRLEPRRPQAREHVARHAHDLHAHPDPVHTAGAGSKGRERCVRVRVILGAVPCARVLVQQYQVRRRCACGAKGADKELWARQVGNRREGEGVGQQHPAAALVRRRRQRAR